MGGRGIKVCERWHDVRNFIADMSPRPDGLSLDRIDNDGDYEPENCRWATVEQQANNRQNTAYITYQGKTQSRKQWARETGIDDATIKGRLDRNWTVERALSKPPFWSDETRNNIYDRYISGERTVLLAKEFDTSAATISRIVKDMRERRAKEKQK